MYGTPVEHLSQKDDKYGFVNEHDIRLGTGMSLVLGIYSFVSILFFGQFDLPMIFLGLIWTDFVLKVFFGPQYSIFGTLAQNFTKNKDPYWVGAVQKRFAWSLGLVLSTFAFICILIISGLLPSFGIGITAYEIVQAMTVIPPMQVPFSPPLVACMLCIIFMTLEAVFGYCVGCTIYAKLVQWGILKKIPGQNCAGGICEV